MDSPTSADDGPSARSADFVRLACSDDFAAARRMLEAAPGLARSGFFPAVVAGEADIVREELRARPAAAREAGGPNGWAPILYACFSRFLRADPVRAAGIETIVADLLAAGADPNAFHLPPGETDFAHRATPLFGAAGVANRASLTKLLLDAGADPNDGHDGIGPESLYHAAEFEDPTCLALVLARGPRPDAVSYCLGRAVDFGVPAVVAEFLKHGADPNFRAPWQGEGVLAKAIRNGSPDEVVTMLLAAGAAVEPGLAASAVRRGRSEIAGRLGDESEATPADRLCGALWRRDGAAAAAAEAAEPTFGPEHHRQLHEAAKAGDPEIVTAMLDAGLDPEFADREGMNALHWACWFGRAEAARRLVERGVPLDRRNGYGGTPLETAIHGSRHCRSEKGGPTMILPEEIAHGDYPKVIALLSAAAPQP